MPRMRQKLPRVRRQARVMDGQNLRSSSIRTGGTKSTRMVNQKEAAAIATPPISRKATASPPEAAPISAMSRAKTVHPTTAARPSTIVARTTSPTRRQYRLHSSPAVIRCPMTDRLTETVSTPLRIEPARSRNGIIEYTPSMDAVASMLPYGSYPSSGRVEPSQLESVGTSRYHRSPPMRQEPATMSALRPNMTFGFARTERNAPS